jgi:hypothetical protein
MVKRPKGFLPSRWYALNLSLAREKKVIVNSMHGEGFFFFEHNPLEPQKLSLEEINLGSTAKKDWNFILDKVIIWEGTCFLIMQEKPDKKSGKTKATGLTSENGLFY